MSNTSSHSLKTGLELLDALSLGPGGVQINVTETKVTVTTQYTPLVRGEGETIIKATSDAAGKVIMYQKRWNNVPKKVMAAVRMYIARQKIHSDST